MLISVFTSKHYSRKNRLGNFFLNFIAFAIILGTFIFFSWGAAEMTEPLKILKYEPISLEYKNLFEYSAQTFLRMFFAMIASIIFTLIYGTLAAKNPLAEKILIPLLDILQSVPILGYISFTVTFFLSLTPGNILGAELAAIFAIFTSQVWNMTFSFYNSLKTVPHDLQEIAVLMNMSKWRKFWLVEVPYSIPNLVWNMVVSISGGWFFVVAAEVISVGSTRIELQGIGSYIALATVQENNIAILQAVLAMIVTILIYDQLLIKPLVAWSDKFCYEANAGHSSPSSWVLSLYRKSFITNVIWYFLQFIFLLFSKILSIPYRLLTGFSTSIHTNTIPQKLEVNSSLNKYTEYLFYFIICSFGLYGSYLIFHSFHNVIGWTEVLTVFKLGFITLLRVFSMIVLSSIIWIPTGIYIGLRPKLCSSLQPIIQFLSAFPVNLLFPIFGVFITRNHLNPDIWLTPLIVIGSQWYILYNVIAGAASFSNELLETSKVFNIKGLLWWRKVMIPAILPAFVTGALTASGGAWNASIVAEVISFGHHKIAAHGLGSYIVQMTTNADFHRISLGIGVMSLLVVLLNRFFWKPIVNYINNRFI